MPKEINCSLYDTISEDCDIMGTCTKDFCKACIKTQYVLRKTEERSKDGN